MTTMAIAKIPKSNFLFTIIYYSKIFNINLCFLFGKTDEKIVLSGFERCD